MQTTKKPARQERKTPELRRQKSKDDPGSITLNPKAPTLKEAVQYHESLTEGATVVKDATARCRRVEVAVTEQPDETKKGGMEEG